MWNVVISTRVYVTLIATAVLVWRQRPIALYGITASSLALLFTIIHSARNIAVWMTVDRKCDKT